MAKDQPKDWRVNLELLVEYTRRQAIATEQLAKATEASAQETAALRAQLTAFQIAMSARQEEGEDDDG